MNRIQLIFSIMILALCIDTMRGMENGNGMRNGTMYATPSSQVYYHPQPRLYSLPPLEYAFISPSNPYQTTLHFTDPAGCYVRTIDTNLPRAIVDATKLGLTGSVDEKAMPFIFIMRTLAKIARPNKLIAHQNKLSDLAIYFCSPTYRLGNIKRTFESIDTVEKLQTALQSITEFIFTDQDFSTKQLPNYFASLSQLMSLMSVSLPRNNMSSCPQWIFYLCNILYLDLSENKICSIPSEIQYMSNLIELNLSNNNLTDLPQEIGSLAQLRILNLYNNKLTEVPKHLCNLSRLEKLNLNKNKITVIPNLDFLKDEENVLLDENPIQQDLRQKNNTTTRVYYYVEDH